MTPWPFEEDTQNEPEFTPLSAEQAKLLRLQQPPLSPWKVVAVQCLVGLALAALAWFWMGRASEAWSAGYGALVAIIPAALFARGLMSRFSSANAVMAGFGFFVWEMVKISVSVAMLVVAPHLVADLDWLALLIGLVVTLKVYWVALLWRPTKRQEKNV
jgi:ATP synthase protein I